MVPFSLLENKNATYSFVQNCSYMLKKKESTNIILENPCFLISYIPTGFILLTICSQNATCSPKDSRLLQYRKWTSIDLYYFYPLYVLLFFMKIFLNKNFVHLIIYYVFFLKVCFSVFWFKILLHKVNHKLDGGI